MHIVFLDRETLAPSVQLKRPSLPHQWTEYLATAPQQVVERLEDATIAIVNKVRLAASDLEQLPKLRLIVLAATGADNIDLAACRELGIQVRNVQGYSGPSVPEHALALMLALSRNLKAWQQSLEAGRWQESGRFCFFDHGLMDLAGRRLGIIGSGTIGRDIGKIAAALGMQVHYAASLRPEAIPDPERLPLERLLAESDVISLHCPLTDQTRNLIGERELALMKPGALLINVGRGGLVDEHALLAALRSGHLGGAGFDVATQEPPAADHPLMQALALPNFILTPHVAWASHDAMQRLAEQVIANIDGFANGNDLRRLV